MKPSEEAFDSPKEIIIPSYNPFLIWIISTIFILVSGNEKLFTIFASVFHEMFISLRPGISAHSQLVALNFDSDNFQRFSISFSSIRKSPLIMAPFRALSILLICPRVVDSFIAIFDSYSNHRSAKAGYGIQSIRTHTHRVRWNYDNARITIVEPAYSSGSVE